MSLVTPRATRQVGPRDEPLLTGPLLWLTAGELGYFTAAGVAVYALPLYVTGPVGAGRAEAGLAFGAFAVTALLLRPLAGRLTDSWGRRPLLVGGALLAAVSMVLTGFVDDLALVVALRLLLGVAEAALLVATFAAVADLAPPTRMAEATSYSSLGLYLGLAAGPPLGELVVRTAGFTATWSVAAGLSLLAAGVVSRVGETRPPTEAPPERQPLVHRASVAPSLGFLAATLAMGGYLAFATLHATEVGVGAVSLPLTLYGLVVVVGRVLFARLMNRVPPLRLAAASLLVIAVGLVLLSVWRSPAGVLVGTVLLGTGVTFSTPAFFAAVFAAAAPSERGAAAGTASAAIDLGLGVGPVLLGLLAGSLGIPVALAVAGGVALAGGVWTIGLARSRLVGAR